jgi:hypothetical protein
MLTILFLVVGLIGTISSQTYVTPGEGTLAQAISEAQDGDVLLLASGTEYTETASSKLGTLVNKNLTLASDSEEKAVIRMLKDDLIADSAGVFFRMGDQSSLSLNNLEFDGNSKIKYFVSYYMPVAETMTQVNKIQIEDCYIHDVTGDVMHGEKSTGLAGYMVFDSTIINNSVFHRTGPVVHYKQAGSDFISITNSTIADVNSYGFRACGYDAQEGSSLPDHTPEVVIDHTTWYNIGTTNAREIILGEKGPILRPWTITNSIFAKQCATGNTKVFINIKDKTTSGESNMGTIKNICFWEIDKIAFYMHTVRDTIRMNPQFADTTNYDFTLPVGSPLLTFDLDGKPIGDPRWGTNYVKVVEQRNIGLPSTLSLAPIYPNPFNPTTTLAFNLPASGEAKLTVYDLRGNEVAVVMNKNLPAGEYRYTFNGSHLLSGVYFCRLTALGQTSTRKMVLLK